MVAGDCVRAFPFKITVNMYSKFSLLSVCLLSSLQQFYIDVQTKFILRPDLFLYLLYQLETPNSQTMRQHFKIAYNIRVTKYFFR